MITLTSKNGAQSTLTTTASAAYIEARGVKFQVQRHELGLQAVFPIHVDGKKIRPIIALDSKEISRADALISEMEHGVKDRLDHMREIDNRQARIQAAMNPDY